MNIQDIYKEASIKLGMSENDIKEIYDSYWYFIRNHITNLPLKENLNKNAFDKLKVNINIPSIGKLYCTWDKYKAIKKRYKNIIELYHDTNNKED